MHKWIALVLHRHFNFKMGVLSGFVTGSIVFIINIGHGFLPALGGFGKQFLFNVFMAGFNARCCEKIVKSIDNTFGSVFIATVIPTLQAFIILYAIHYFGGTPKALASTVWQVPFNLGIFFFLALVYGGTINIKNTGFKRITRVFKLNPLLPVKRLNVLVQSRRKAS